MKRILRPFEGLDEIAFGLPMSEVKRQVGIDASTVRNKHLHQEVVSADQITYVFEKGSLVAIELKYQEGIYFNDVDIFNTPEVEALLQGYSVESKRNVVHIKALGLILFSFQVRDRKKRELWYYSKAMLPEYETFLDVV